jgi:hypothetical protein
LIVNGFAVLAQWYPPQEWSAEVLLENITTAANAATMTGVARIFIKGSSSPGTRRWDADAARAV